jgi:hypothetical protein
MRLVARFGCERSPLPAKGAAAVHARADDDRRSRSWLNLLYDNTVDAAVVELKGFVLGIVGPKLVRLGLAGSWPR